MKPFPPLLAAALALFMLPAAGHAQASATPAPSAAGLSQYPTADTLWMHIQALKATRENREAPAEARREALTGLLVQIHDAATEFVKRYPEDPRKWDARLLEIEVGNSLAVFEHRADTAGYVNELRELSADSDAPTPIRGQARYELLALSLHAYELRDPAVSSASILSQVRQFAIDFPTYPSLDLLKYQIAEMMNQIDPASAASLLKELADSGEGRVADQARKEVAIQEKLKSPLDLRFTALDGSQVDLSKMRGKVVLVEFWATGSPPCRAGMPELLYLYNTLHAKGFEIIGISLDGIRPALLEYLAQNSIPWPQYFDGKGWNNQISSSFGIRAIPTLWLVNKQGYVVNAHARADLQNQVAKLLAE